MATAPSTGMEKADMRSLLKKAAPDHPINFAFGQGKESAVALLKMDKSKSPKACSKMLDDEFGEVKNPRFGTLTVNPEIDSTLVRFKVNKPTSGMAKRLIKTLKGTSYSKVEIVLEDDTLVEASADEEMVSDATSSGQGDDASDDAPPQSQTPDPAALSRQLAVLLKRIPASIAANPAAKEGLLKSANAANAALKSGQLETVPPAIEDLQKILDAATPSSQPAQADPAVLAHTLGLLLKQIPAVIAANPAAKTNLMQLATEANANLKIQKLTEAEASIEALRQALDSGSAPEEEDTIKPADLLEWLDDLAAQAAALKSADRTELMAQAKAARQSVETDPNTAAPILAELANRIAEATRATRMAEVQLVSGDTVTAIRLQRDWQNALGQAHAQLRGFVDTLLADPELQEDERFERLKEAVPAILALIPDDGGRLDTALQELNEAGGPKEAEAARKVALAAVAAFRADLEAEEDLDGLQAVANDAFDGVPFQTDLRKSLNALAAQLERRAA